MEQNSIDIAVLGFETLPGPKFHIVSTYRNLSKIPINIQKYIYRKCCENHCLQIFKFCWQLHFYTHHFCGLMQERRYSMADALESRLPCTNQSIDIYVYIYMCVCVLGDYRGTVNNRIKSAFWRHAIWTVCSEVQIWIIDHQTLVGCPHKCQVSNVEGVSMSQRHHQRDSNSRYSVVCKRILRPQVWFCIQTISDYSLEWRCLTKLKTRL